MVEEIAIQSISKQERSRDFNLESHTVSALFYGFLEGLHAGKAKKISIALYNFEPKVSFIDDNDVILIKLNADLTPYFQLDEYGRKVWIIQKIYQGLKILSHNIDVSWDAVESAYKECIARDFKNTAVLGDILDLRTVNMTGVIICEHLTDKFIMRLKLFSNDGLRVMDIHIRTMKPYYLDYYKYLGDIAVDGNTITLKTIEGTKFFSYTVQSP